MKFLRFAILDVNKIAEQAQVVDKVQANLPAGIKVLARYVCQGIPFDGVPRHSMVGIDIIEAESNEALATTEYPCRLSGVDIWNVPVLEMPVKSTAKAEKKYRR